MFNLRLFGTSVETADNLPIQLYARENEKKEKIEQLYLQSKFGVNDRLDQIHNIICVQFRLVLLF
jgi:hypothetical protein